MTQPHLRILVVAACPFPWPRGTPARVLRLSQALARRGHAVQVVTYPLGIGAANGLDVVRVRDFPGYADGSPGPSWTKLLALDPALVLEVRERVVHERPDVVYAHHYEALGVALLARGRSSLPVVYDAHTTLESELPDSGMLPGRAFKRMLGGWLDGLLVPRADAVTCVNESLVAALARMRPGASPPTTVPNGVDVRAFPPSRPRPRGARTLVFAGNLAGYQGIESMLHSFKRIADAERGVRLRIVTSTEADLGPYDTVVDTLGIRDRLEHLRVPFDEIPSLLVDSDVALHPRLPCAGTPLKLLNYMAAGLPIVSFAGSAHGLRNGHNATIVPDGDVEAFATATLDLVRDPARAAAMGRNGRVTVTEEYDWDSSAERAEEVLERARAARPTPRPSERRP